MYGQPSPNHFSLGGISIKVLLLLMVACILMNCTVVISVCMLLCLGAAILSGELPFLPVSTSSSYVLPVCKEEGVIDSATSVLAQASNMLAQTTRVQTPPPSVSLSTTTNVPLQAQTILPKGKEAIRIKSLTPNLANLASAASTRPLLAKPKPADFSVDTRIIFLPSVTQHAAMNESSTTVSSYKKSESINSSLPGCDQLVATLPQQTTSEALVAQQLLVDDIDEPSQGLVSSLPTPSSICSTNNTTSNSTSTQQALTLVSQSTAADQVAPGTIGGEHSVQTEHGTFEMVKLTVSEEASLGKPEEPAKKEDFIKLISQESENADQFEEPQQVRVFLIVSVFNDMNLELPNIADTLPVLSLDSICLFYFAND